jgi:hypothetical protein
MLHFTSDTFHLVAAPTLYKYLWTPVLNIVQLVRGVSMTCDETRREYMFDKIVTSIHNKFDNEYFISFFNKPTVRNRYDYIITYPK